MISLCAMPAGILIVVLAPAPSAWVTFCVFPRKRTTVRRVCGFRLKCKKHLFWLRQGETDQDPNQRQHLTRIYGPPPLCLAKATA